MNRRTMHTDNISTSSNSAILTFWEHTQIFSLCGVLLFLPVSIAFTDICLAILFLTYLAEIIRTKHIAWPPNPFTRPFLVYGLITLISTIFSVNRGKSVYNLTNLNDLAVFFLFYLALQNTQRIKKGSTLLLVSVTIAASYGILQHYIEVDLFRLTQPIGLLKHLHNDLSAPLRISGFSSYMTFGGQLGMAVPIIFAFVSGIKNRFSRGLWGLALLICSLALLWTYTRSAWLGAVGAILVIGTLQHKRKFLIDALCFLLLVGGGIAFLSFTQGLSPEQSFQAQQAKSSSTGQAEQTDQPKLPARGQSSSSNSQKILERIASIFRTKDNQERLYTWLSSLAMIRDHPLTGIGHGNYSAECWNYRTPYKDFNFSSDAHAHNNILQVTVISGIPALCCFLWIWWIVFRSTYRSFRLIPTQFPREKALALGIFGATIAFFIQGFFEHNFGDSEVVTMLWALVAFSMRLQELHRPIHYNASESRPNSCSQS